MFTQHGSGVHVTYQGYAERDLVKNRSSLLIFGATEPERRAWAEAAAWSFPDEGALRVLGDESELSAALSHGKGVLYIPDATALGNAGQTELVRALREREERPKLVLGLPASSEKLRETGKLRLDLLYSLQMAQVNLDLIPVRQRAKPPKVTARAAASPKPAARGASRSAKATPASRPAPKPARPAQPARPAPKPAARKGSAPAKKAARKAARKAPAARKPQRKAQPGRKSANRRR